MNRGIEEDVTYKIKARWIKWRNISGSVHGPRIPIMLKGKFYKSTIRQTLQICFKKQRVKTRKEKN